MSKTPELTGNEASYCIRAAHQTDLSAILLLIEPFVERDQLLRRSPEETSALIPTGFVAEFDDAVVGFCSVEIYSRKLAEIQCLAVSSEHQGQGLGRRLVACCVDRAREAGVMEVMAISSSEGFLEGLGFDYSLPQQKRALFLQLRERQ